MPNRPATHKPRRANTKRHTPEGFNNDSWREGKTTAQRGYGGQWQRERAAFLLDNPFCANHLENKNVYVVGKVVDHKKPHRGNKKLFWDKTNWQTLCQQCHNSKTGKGY